MARYIFNDDLVNALTRKVQWPSYEGLRKFRREKCDGKGFKNNSYKLVRQGFATEDHQFLIDILLCICDCAPSFYQDEFGTDWRSQNERELSCLLYTSPSPRDATLSRMPSSA